MGAEGYLVGQDLEDIRFVLDQLTIPAFTKDLHGRMSVVNDAFCALTGLGQEAILGRPAHAFLSGPLLSVFETVDQALLFGGGEQTYEATLKSVVRHQATVRVTKRRLQGRDGRVLGIIGTVEDITAQRSLQHGLRDALYGTVRAVSLAMDTRDPYTGEHQRHVAALSVLIARELGWEMERIEGLRIGALLHDIGKIHIPAEILNRPGKITDPEMAMIRSHAEVGHSIVSHIVFPWPVSEMVAQHHERLDGSGYPHGLSSGAIIDEARVLAVADVFEAMTAHRPYRASRGLDAARAELERGREEHYDVTVVEACQAVIDKGLVRFDGGEMVIGDEADSFLMKEG